MTCKLAIDTSSNAGSIALQKDGKVVYINYADSLTTHSETLMPHINEAFKTAQIKPKDLDAILLANGPGSFTGLRIALATAKGIAYPHKIPILPFYTLEANAVNFIKQGKHILSIVDAKMDELYLALYDESLKEIIPPTCCSYGQAVDIIQKELTSNLILCGDKPDKLLNSLKENNICFSLPAGIADLKICTALFALQDIHNKPLIWDAEAFAELEPFYVRKTIAQINKTKQ